MLRLLPALAVLGVFASCTLGPGVRCQSDGDCQGWGRCERVSDVGYCVESGAVQAPAQEEAASPAPLPPLTAEPCSDAPCTPPAAVDAPPSQAPPALDSGTTVPAPAQTDGGMVTIAPGQLTFGAGGFVACGTRALAQSVGVTNASLGALQLSHALDAAAALRFRVLAPTSINAGASATVTVTPEPIPAAASTVPDAFGGRLTLTVSGATRTESFPIALHQTAQGAVLSLDPTSLSFSTEWGKKQSKPFTLTNRGNLAAPFALVVGGSDPLNFTATPVTGQVAVGASVSGQATFVAPLMAPKARAATVSVSTTAVVCAPLPTMSLTGSVK